MLDTPKGNTVPQTLENLQQIMARDAVLMHEMSKVITQLRHQNQRLKDRLTKKARNQCDKN